MRPTDVEQEFLILTMRVEFVYEFNLHCLNLVGKQ